MTDRTTPKEHTFRFDDLKGGSLVNVHCEFCPGEPTRIEIKVFSDAEVDHVLVKKGWSILAGKEICPACTRRVIGIIEKDRNG